MSVKELKPIKSGKVREIYDNGDSLIMVATDRISCYDVILKNVIRRKGTVLTQMSKFWFDFTKDVVKNHMIDMAHGLDNEKILRLTILLNTNLTGLTLEQINLSTIQKLKEEAGIHSEVISRVLDIIAEAISQESDPEIYTSGATNFFKYPELSDTEKASELIGTFEEKHPLAGLMTDESGESSEKNGIQIYIGQETPVETMRDCSVVTASYDLGGGMVGKIGIVGPKRMDYEKVVGVLRTILMQLDAMYGKHDS